MNFTLDDIKKSKVADKNKHLFTEPGKKVKRTKYGSVETIIGGVKFQSKKESQRYAQLLIRLKLGEISLLELQKKYVLIEKNGKERKCSYLCDFEYIVTATGKKVVEDVKSSATRKLSSYVIKRKLMLEKHGIEIIEI